MTSNYHTPIATGAAANASTFNSPMGELDDAIGDLYATQRAKVYKAADQSVSVRTETTLQFDAEYWDTDTIHDTSTNNSRLTCKTAGIYVVTANVVVEGVDGTGGEVWAGIRENGSDLRAQGYGEWIRDTESTPFKAEDAGISISVELDLDVNDYVEIRVYIESGSGSFDVLSGLTTFSIRRVSDSP